MGNRPSYYGENAPKLQDLLDELGMEYERFGQHDDQWRIYGATHIIDIWPARMIYHRIGGETVKSNEPYCRDMDWQFNREQVERLVKTGNHEVPKRVSAADRNPAVAVTQIYTEEHYKEGIKKEIKAVLDRLEWVVDHPMESGYESMKMAIKAERKSYE